MPMLRPTRNHLSSLHPWGTLRVKERMNMNDGIVVPVVEEILPPIHAEEVGSRSGAALLHKQVLLPIMIKHGQNDNVVPVKAVIGLVLLLGGLVLGKHFVMFPHT